ncbi:tRNA preQ1(34) S-adenosylmethionine ribosyltransferase-isomerase QueA [Maritalea sp.]|uniref:tRNA preQ1(34) S-adenosylmethionine ribosyltransferase-isomerase QueA n=1 Tax=Maritalea sp. TaxID=2003361 RepID=UPI003EF42471
MRVDQFDFELPAERVALHPAVPRDSARMLVIDPVSMSDGKPPSDHVVTDLLSFLRPGDILIANNTRVLPAELVGKRIRGDAIAKVTVNLHKRDEPDLWRAFARPAKKLKLGEELIFEKPDMDPLVATCENKGESGEVLLRFDRSGAELDEAIKARGAMPLPPYISAKRDHDSQDDTDYQTIYAEHDGAVAAPTAGLHFTDELMANIKMMGVEVDFVTLHVGAGTFLPVKVDDTKDHQMHAEWGELSEITIEKIKKCRANGGRLVAVGTTSMRVLETASASGELKPFCGETSIFITPGYQFNAVDILMTNFHLPKSTLFMLVSAFSGFENMRRAYAHAIENEYRFYSFGDASLLFREQR